MKEVTLKSIIISFPQLSPTGQKPTLPLHQAAPQNQTAHLLPALYKAPKLTQPLHFHPQHGKCNAFHGTE